MRQTPPMMKCGHAANAVNRATEKPCCAICIGISPGAEEIDENPGSLEGRMATCPSCMKEKPSDPSLAFFEHRPTYKTDSYYCGCRGWD